MGDVAHKHMPGSCPSHVPSVLWKWIFWRSDRHCRKLRHTKLLPGASGLTAPTLSHHGKQTAPSSCCHAWILSPAKQRKSAFQKKRPATNCTSETNVKQQKANPKNPSSFLKAQWPNPLPRKLIKWRGINLEKLPASRWQIWLGVAKKVRTVTPRKIDMEHNHGGLEDHFPF